MQATITAEEATVTCRRCHNSEPHPSHRPYVGERDGRLAVVTRIPVEECGACGEVWLPEEVAIRLDEMLREMLAIRRDEDCVPVVNVGDELEVAGAGKVRLGCGPRLVTLPDQPTGNLTWHAVIDDEAQLRPPCRRALPEEQPGCQRT